MAYKWFGNKLSLGIQMCIVLGIEIDIIPDKVL